MEHHKSDFWVENSKFGRFHTVHKGAQREITTWAMGASGGDILRNTHLNVIILFEAQRESHELSPDRFMIYGKHLPSYSWLDLCAGPLPPCACARFQPSAKSFCALGWNLEQCARFKPSAKSISNQRTKYFKTCAQKISNLAHEIFYLIHAEMIMNLS